MEYNAEQLAAYTEEELARSLSITQEDGSLRYLFIPTDIQAEIMAATETNLFVYGNRGGGKSVALRWLCHMLALSVPNFRYAILRTSFPELMKNHLIYLDDEMGEFGGDKAGFTYHKTDHICYYENGSKGFYAQCATDADVKKILGAEVAMVVFDEAPTFEWEHMRLIAASVRVTKGSGLKPMVRYLGNPVGESIDELWRYFIDKDVDLKDDPGYLPVDWRAIEIRHQDNPHLDVEAYRKQFVGLSEHYRKAWLDGERTEERTLFDFRPKKLVNGEYRPYHVVDELPTMGDGTPLLKQGWVRIYRSYDHGFDPDPAVCLWFAVFGRRIICYKEKFYKRTIAKDIAKDIVAETAYDGQPLRVTASYCDPSIDVQTGADVVTIRQTMELAGMPLDPSINNREYFSHAIHSALQEEVQPDVPRIQFYSRGCPTLIKYLPRMKWSETKPGAMAEHKHDHGPVALAYFLLSTIPESSPSDATVLRKWQRPKVRKTLRPRVR